MRVPFRQGIVSVPSTFLQQTGGGVSLTFPQTNTVIVTFADGGTNYLLTERATVANAWAGPFVSGINYWLYWDIDRRTGQRTFGHTRLEPVESSVAPLNPANDQHWFDTTTNRMMVWSGVTTSWQHRIRVFAAKLQSGSILISVSIDAPLFTGTQVGALESTPVSAGALVFDNNNQPIKRSNGTFFTTEDVVVTGIGTSTQVKLGSIVVEAVAASNIPAFSVVNFVDFNEIVLTTNSQMASEGVYGVVEQDAVIGDIVNVVLEGLLTNPLWDWSAAGVNAPVFVTDDGYLTTAAPANPIAVGAVVDRQSIIIRPTLQTITFSGGNPTEFVDTAGDTMTGYLTLSGNPVNNFHAATKQYVDQRPIALNDLTDVVVPTPATGNLLSFNGTNWVNTAPPVIPVIPPIPDTLDELNDVVVPAPSTGDLLSFNGTNWVNTAPPIIPVIPAFPDTLDELTDVVVPTPSSGDLLSFNGTNWVNTPPAVVPQALNDLTDVVTTGQTTGDVLTYNGSSWTPAAPTGGGGGSGNTTQIVRLQAPYGAGFSNSYRYLYNVIPLPPEVVLPQYLSYESYPETFKLDVPGIYTIRVEAEITTSEMPTLPNSAKIHYGLILTPADDLIPLHQRNYVQGSAPGFVFGDATTAAQPNVISVSGEFSVMTNGQLGNKFALGIHAGAYGFFDLFSYSATLYVTRIGDAPPFTTYFIDERWLDSENIIRNWSTFQVGDTNTTYQWYDGQYLANDFSTDPFGGLSVGNGKAYVQTDPATDGGDYDAFLNYEIPSANHFAEFTIVIPETIFTFPGGADTVSLYVKRQEPAGGSYESGLTGENFVDMKIFPLDNQWTAPFDSQAVAAGSGTGFIDWDDGGLPHVVRFEVTPTVTRIYIDGVQVETVSYPVNGNPWTATGRIGFGIGRFSPNSIEITRIRVGLLE